MATAVFELRRDDGLLFCSLSSMGGVWGGSVSADNGAAISQLFPQGKGMQVLICRVRDGAHDVSTGVNGEGVPFVTLSPRSISRRSFSRNSSLQVFFR